MTAKRELDALIDSRVREPLLEAARDPGRASKLIRRILGRLYSRDPAVKWRAVAALGVVSAEGVMEDKKALDLIKRLYWTLSDESGSVPFGVPEALGEIFANRPSLQPGNTPILVSYLVHKDMVQTGPILAGAIWAVGRVGIEDPEERQRALRGLESALATGDGEVRGAALWTLTRLGVAHELRESVEARLEDEASVSLLVDGEVRDLKLADLAHAALKAD